MIRRTETPQRSVLLSTLFVAESNPKKTSDRTFRVGGRAPAPRRASHQHRAFKALWTIGDAYHAVCSIPFLLLDRTFETGCLIEKLAMCITPYAVIPFRQQTSTTGHLRLVASGNTSKESRQHTVGLAHVFSKGLEVHGLGFGPGRALPCTRRL